MRRRIRVRRSVSATVASWKARLPCRTSFSTARVKGDILAHDRVELGATARVTGNVYYALIEMEMGAEINGKLIHEPRKKGGRRPA